MNGIHNRLCRSDKWHDTVEHRLLPWALNGVALGDDVLEIGPGFGATTRLLATRARRLTAVEINPALAEQLRATLPPTVTVVEGDGSDLPFPDGAFSAVVCFTMLHHVPSKEQQDRLFAQAHRVLAPGGVFAGSDSRISLRFRLLHIGDVMVPVDPASLADRLRAAGFGDAEVSTVKTSLRFRATR
jgi:SAM-dependent methyltransferase